MNRLLPIFLTLIPLSFPGGRVLQNTALPLPGDSRIIVSPAKVLNRITPYMYGSCIEDVNHEIYGGLYAQRIFGESFEEPPNSTISGWTTYGGDWNLRDGALHVEADAGAKFVRGGPVVGDGTVTCDLRFADASGDNAGLILRVSDPHIGPDPWIGYEISLSAHNHTLILGRHRHNWELLRSVPATVEAGHWYRLRVEMKATTLRIFLDDGVSPLIEYSDEKDFLAPGLVGVRTWNSQAAFRHLTITVGTQTVSDRLDGTEQNRSDLVLSRNWDPIVTGRAKPRFVWDSSNAFNSRHSQQIIHRGGTGTVGIANRGLNRWGIAVRKGKPMQGHLYMRGQSKPDLVTVALQSADGSRIYSRQQLIPAGNGWTRRDFRLVPTVTDPNARFALYLENPGSIAVDQVYLSDTDTALFKKDVFRADIGNALVKEGITFLRYGGTMVNAPEYRWKKMIGDRDRRPQYRGHWYPYSTNGFGIEEFLRFCEAARIEPAFAINSDETPEDAADLVEYLNGSITSAWGAKRAANGHPKPYNVHYIEIGNEEGLDGNPDWYRHYLERFKLLYAAMHPRDPKVKYVIAAWWNPEQPICRQIAQELGDKAALWDVHMDADNLRDADRADQTLTRMQQLLKAWIPGSPLRACIFEENGNRHDLQRALGHARVLNVAQRHGDFVQMDCPANCLQPMGQNDNGWDQGQLFFLPDKVWGMPPYYAQQMAAYNHQPLRVACETTSPDNDLDVTATKSADGKTLILKVVNSGAVSHNADLQVTGFVPVDTASDIWTLSGDLTAVNTPDMPESVRSVHTRKSFTGSSFSCVFEPYSYTILRLRQH